MSHKNRGQIKCDETLVFLEMCRTDTVASANVSNCINCQTCFMTRFNMVAIVIAHNEDTIGGNLFCIGLGRRLIAEQCPFTVCVIIDSK